MIINQQLLCIWKSVFTISKIPVYPRLLETTILFTVCLADYEVAFFFFLFLFFFLVFLELYLRYTEVPRLGVESKL